ncbi:hypothetical protein D9M71_39070 [compost metagenome]
MSEWIKCSDRLPEVASRLSQPCNINGREIPALNRSVEVITFDGHRVWGRRMEWFDEMKPLSGVTHWMPLPEPPK